MSDRMARSNQQLAANDLRVADLVATRTVTLDRAAFVQFANLTGDRHPIHYDPDYAMSKGFRGPVAHGLLLLAVSALGATDLSDKLHDSMVAMTGANAKFLGPVIEGDALRLDYKVAAISPRANDMSKVSFDVCVYRMVDEHESDQQPSCVFLLEFLLKNNRDSSDASKS